MQPCQPRPPRRYLQIIQHTDRELAHYGSYAGVAITDINAYDAMQPVAEPATQLKRPRDMFVSAQGFLRDARMQRRLITFAAAHDASTLYVEASKAVTEGRQVHPTVAASLSSPSVRTIASTSAHACSARARGLFVFGVKDEISDMVAIAYKEGLHVDLVYSNTLAVQPDLQKVRLLTPTYPSLPSPSPASRAGSSVHHSDPLTALATKLRSRPSGGGWGDAGSEGVGSDGRARIRARAAGGVPRTRGVRLARQVRRSAGGRAPALRADGNALRCAAACRVLFPRSGTSRTNS